MDEGRGPEPCTDSSSLSIYPSVYQPVYLSISLSVCQNTAATGSSLMLTNWKRNESSALAASRAPLMFAKVSLHILLMMRAANRFRVLTVWQRLLFCCQVAAGYEETGTLPTPQLQQHYHYHYSYSTLLYSTQICIIWGGGRGQKGFCHRVFCFLSLNVKHGRFGVLLLRLSRCFSFGEEPPTTLEPRRPSSFVSSSLDRTTTATTTTGVACDNHRRRCQRLR